MSIGRSAASNVGKSRAKIALRVAMAVGAAGGIVGVFGAGTAAADPGSRTLQYTCAFPMLGDQPMTVKVDPDTPKSVAVGEPTTFVIDAVATVNETITQGLGWVGAKTLEGTADAKISVATPHDVTVPIDITKTTLPESGPFDVKATGTVPARTFSQPGNAKITAGDLILHLAPKDANGNLTLLGQFDAPCKLNAGQNNVVASFDITETKAGSAPSRTTGTAASGTTGSTVSGTTGAIKDSPTGPPISGTTDTTTGGSPGGTTPSTTGSAANGTKGGTIDDTKGGTTGGTTGRTTACTSATTGGQGTKDPILLAVCTLVAGAVGFLFGSRLKHHRRTADNA